MSEYNWIDDTFRIEKKKWGTYQSFDKEGNGIITSLTEEQCIFSTRHYLKSKFEDKIDETVTKYDGKMSYQL